MPEFITSDNIRLSYDDEGKGKTLLFMHGWTADKLSFQFVIPNLIDKYRVISYDHRGHGESEIPEQGLTLSRLATDLEELLVHLKLDEVILVGWSMGAHVLFEYIKKYGCQRLKAVIPVDMAPKILNDENWKMGIYNEDFDFAEGLKEMVAMCDNWADYVRDYQIPKFAPRLEVGSRVYEVILKLLQNNSPHVMYALWGSLMASDYRETIKQITVPTLIMYGELSPLYRADVFQYMHENIPQSSLKCIQGSGHSVATERPVLFNQAIEDFIKEWNL